MAEYAFQIPDARFVLPRGSLRFSSTVSEGNTARSSGTYPSPRVAIWCGLWWVMGVPLWTMVPSLMGTSPMMALRVVVFPAPFRPRSAATCPSGISNERPLRAWLSP